MRGGINELHAKPQRPEAKGFGVTASGAISLGQKMKRIAKVRRQNTPKSSNRKRSRVVGIVTICCAWRLVCQFDAVGLPQALQQKTYAVGSAVKPFEAEYLNHKYAIACIFALRRVACALRSGDRHICGRTTANSIAKSACRGIGPRRKIRAIFHQCCQIHLESADSAHKNRFFVAQ
jgi:hypothetical protein